MKRTYKTDINVLTQSYIYSKREVEEADMGYFRRRREEIDNSRYIVKHIEAVTDSLDYKSKIIIENEVLKHRSGKWYMDYFSSATYYRSRNKAYKDFLSELEKK